jgi:hypothetical protein
MPGLPQGREMGAVANYEVCPSSLVYALHHLKGCARSTVAISKKGALPQLFRISAVGGQDE